VVPQSVALPTPPTDEHSTDSVVKSFDFDEGTLYVLQHPPSLLPRAAIRRLKCSPSSITDERAGGARRHGQGITVGGSSRYL